MELVIYIILIKHTGITKSQISQFFIVSAIFQYSKSEDRF